MPLLNVSLAVPPDPDLSLQVASTLTRLTNVHLGKDPALTAVAIRYLEPDHWFIGGQAVSAGKAPSFSLQIAVTSGTNTKTQMADYIDAVFAEMTGLLGSVRDESYIIVNELPAPGWGYAGQTQEHRFVAGRL